MTTNIERVSHDEFLKQQKATRVSHDERLAALGVLAVILVGYIWSQYRGYTQADIAWMAFWFIPAGVALYRKHPNKLAIVALNVGMWVPTVLFLMVPGENFVARFMSTFEVVFFVVPCWLAALVWSFWQIKR